MSQKKNNWYHEGKVYDLPVPKCACSMQALSGYTAPQSHLKSKRPQPNSLNTTYLLGGARVPH